MSSRNAVSDGKKRDRMGLSGAGSRVVHLPHGEYGEEEDDIYRQTSSSSNRQRLGGAQEARRAEEHAPDTSAGGHAKQAQQASSSHSHRASSQKMSFEVLCRLFSMLHTPGFSMKKKKVLLKKLFERYKENYFPLLRLLLPHLDKERQTYGLKESTLAKAYIRLLNISEKSTDGQRILNWRRPTGGQTGGGDFGLALEALLRNRCVEHGDLNIEEVNSRLDKLNQATDGKTKLRVLRSFVGHVSAEQHRWLVRIILRELKLGISEKTVLNCLHPRAMDLFNITSSLRNVCEKLDQGNDDAIVLAASGIELFSPVKPMLASRRPPETVVSLMGNSEFVIEKKFDGERVQIHRRGDTFRMFSRNSNEVTRTYGHLLIPILQRGIIPATVILDGELIVYDTVTNRFEDFGKLKTLAVGTRPDAPAEAAAAVAGKQLCYVAFDILYVNERSCMGEPLVKRHELLSRCIKVTEHELEVVEWQRAVSTQQLVDALDQAIVRREEGLMVKNLNSPYVPDLRQDAWLKIKPEYLQGVGDHMDLLIVGGYFGVGRRANNVSHFMVGVRGPEHTSERPQFYSFAKVGSGYSDTELRQLQDRLQAHWCIYNTSQPPPHLVLAEPFRERPDVYLDPRNSVVLEVKAAQVVTTEKFRTGYTMRFPRVERIRFDKGWEDGMDMAQLREVALEFEGRFGRRRYDGGGSSMPKKRARRKLPRSRVAARTVLQQYQPADVSGVHVVEDLFGGAEYCVMNGDTDHPKDALERLLVQYGAEVVQYPTSSTHLVVAARKTLRCMNLIRIGSFDVVHPLYVVESVAARRLQELLPKYLLFATIATQQRLQDKVDSYGDPYEFDATIKSLQDAFAEVDKLKPASEQWTDASAEEIDEFLCAFDARLFATPPEWALFRGAVVYLDRYRELAQVESLLEASGLDAVGYLLRYHGARISTEIAADITHVLLDSDSLERLPDIRLEVRRLLYQPPHTKVRHVLFKAWVFDSVRRNEVLDERDYYP